MFVVTLVFYFVIGVRLFASTSVLLIIIPLAIATVRPSIVCRDNFNGGATGAFQDQVFGTIVNFTSTFYFGSYLFANIPDFKVLVSSMARISKNSI